MYGGDPGRIRTCDPQIRKLTSYVGVIRFFAAMFHSCNQELVSNLGRVLINRQPNADLDVPPNVRYWG
jgi:hypothetical protein